MSKTTNQSLSIEIMYQLTKFLNHEEQTHGKITINNKRIWHGWLHNMNNTVWYACVSTMLELHKQHPELFTDRHVNSFRKARVLIENYSHVYDNVLDQQTSGIAGKPTAWACMLGIREVWNAACEKSYLDELFLFNA